MKKVRIWQLQNVIQILAQNIFNNQEHKLIYEYYDQGKDNEEILDRAFDLFNGHQNIKQFEKETNQHILRVNPNIPSHPLTVGDVVEINNYAYRADRLGWTKL